MLDRTQFDSISDPSPFETKDGPIGLARGAGESARLFLNAGRGNPNWTAAQAQLFLLLGQFALVETWRPYHDPKAGIAGMPRREGSHLGLTKWIRKRLVTEATVYLDEEGRPAANTLSAAVDFAIARFGFDPRCLRLRVDPLNHWLQLPGARPGAPSQRDRHPRTPDGGDVRGRPAGSEVRPLPCRRRQGCPCATSSRR